MYRLFARVRSFVSGLRRAGRIDAEMNEEMRFHMELEAQRLTRERGLEPREARRQAALAFGNVEQWQEEGRAVRGLSQLNGLSLDVKLAWRMIRKSPGLTLVAGLGMTLSIAVCVGFFTVATSFLSPRIPLHHGDRLVALENWDVAANDEELRSLHDFLEWRRALKTVQPVAAAHMGLQRLVSGAGEVTGVTAAQMTASGFEVARVQPLLGRYLTADDERVGTPLVAVIGHALWQSHFDSDPSVLGSDVLLGAQRHTIVGVMPPGFAFPMKEQLWTPLRVDPAIERGEGPSLFVFGRLADGVTVQQAQTELAAFGRRAAQAYPMTNGRLRPRVLPYTYPLAGMRDSTRFEFGLAQFLVTLLLTVVAVNVAVLVYARTALRRGEIAIRSALGATRRRIVGQLFIEALVLSGGAALLGLVVAQVVLNKALEFMRRMPSLDPGFWVDYGLQPATVVYAVGLTVLAAVIVGVVPALQSTGRRVQAEIGNTTAGRGLRLGKAWTAMIVTQVAVAVALLPTALAMTWSEADFVGVRPAYPAKEFLRAELILLPGLQPGVDSATYERQVASRFGTALTELVRRVAADPAVAGVTYVTSGRADGAPVHVEGAALPSRLPFGHWVNSIGVDSSYFRVFGASMLTGRTFAPEDFGEAATAVIVNRAFVQQVLGGGNALGRRIRYNAAVREDDVASHVVEPWYEIVGVVENLEVNRLDPSRIRSAVYHPAPPDRFGQAMPVMLIRVRGDDPASYVARFREIAGSVDAALKLNGVDLLARSNGVPRLVLVLGSAVLAVLLAVIGLSTAGIHALMSFAVTRQRREIGIRAALGAQPRRLLASIFARAVLQVGTGVVVGAAIALRLLTHDGSSTARAAIFLGIIALLTLGAGSLAALGPARRGLGIQPLEALRSD